MGPARQSPVELRTERLLLRQWREDDRDAFAALNADPAVMEYFPAPLDRQVSDALLDRLRDGLAARGWGLWAVQRSDGGPALGFVGLNLAGEEMPVGPAVEVGWRLARQHWGRGYAPEAATRAVRFAFEELGLDEVVSFTTVRNDRSRRVMEKIGLTHDPARDFDHPRTPGWWGQRHVLYALSRDDWLAAQPAGGHNYRRRAEWSTWSGPRGDFGPPVGSPP